MGKANDDIRQEIKCSGLKCWQIADALHISESTFTRRLRHEMSAEEKKELRRIIRELSAS